MTSPRAPYEWHMINDVHSRSKIYSRLPTQSSDPPATQEGEHAQSIHDAATGLLIPFEVVATTRTYLTPVYVTTEVSTGDIRYTHHKTYRTK